MAGNIGTIFEWLVFLGMAFTSLIASLLLITRKNPIHGALFLVLNFLCVAVLYLLLQSQFIAIVQVVVYAGAIVMLIVFVIMLLDLEEELRAGLKLFYSKVIGSALAVGVKVGVSSDGKVAVESSAGTAVSVGATNATGGETGRISSGSGTSVGVSVIVVGCKTAWVSVPLSAVA